MMSVTNLSRNGSALENRSGDGGPHVVTEGDLRSRVRRHLEFIYPDVPLDRLVDDVLVTLGLEGTELETASGPRWDQHEVAVITYADSITEAGRVPMQTMHELLDDLTGDVVSVVHVLPFYPASSDGGFAITDHRAVDPRLGSWDDITDLSETYTVMADLVVNHVSADHPWMEQFCSGEEPGSRFLLTAEPEDDLSSVVRPRTTPLLREVETSDGPRLLWCTFSYDQIDLDFAEPEVLLDLLRTVARLVDAGVRWFRLDAIAYLWKELGTSCVNLPQTHEFVKLLRTLLDARCGDSVIITETNVPHDQNVAYWGDGDEAHLVYNFSLPPLVAHTMLSGSSAAMQQWLAQLETPPAGTSFFNFIASHDGIGLRPVEGLLSAAEINRLIAAAHSAGGTHSEFDTPAGPKAYELNVSLWDLFAGDGDPLGVAQFLAAHTDHAEPRRRPRALRACAAGHPQLLDADQRAAPHRHRARSAAGRAEQAHHQPAQGHLGRGGGLARRAGWDPPQDPGRARPPHAHPSCAARVPSRQPAGVAGSGPAGTGRGTRQC